jgi:hypothetical protein
VFATLIAFIYLRKNNLWEDWDGAAGFSIILSGASELLFYVWIIGMLFGRW